MPSRRLAPGRPSQTWAVVFDGGSLGNPGHGYGSYRLRLDGGDWSGIVRLEHGNPITNNEAEYRTLVAALEDLLARTAEPATVAVEILGDSKLVIEQLAGRWKVRAANLAADHLRARALLNQFGRVRLTWQPRARSVALLGH